MLDAYERITLEAGARGSYRTTFTVPDTYGIFKFRVHYRRSGYTVLSFSTQVRWYSTCFRFYIGFSIYKARLGYKRVNVLRPIGQGSVLVESFYKFVMKAACYLST